MNYSSKKAQILNVLSWSAKDWIDTYYFDESGFSLDSNAPADLFGQAAGVIRTVLK